ncbi:MAG: hypothetical protein JNL04_12685 [Rhodospirillaceae bacterium]|nr:hypothetical protein [Rhodospirillaceae bacterium]
MVAETDAEDDHGGAVAIGKGIGRRLGDEWTVARGVDRLSGCVEDLVVRRNDLDRRLQARRRPEEVVHLALGRDPRRFGIEQAFGSPDVDRLSGRRIADDQLLDAGGRLGGDDIVRIQAPEELDVPAMDPDRIVQIGNGSRHGVEGLIGTGGAGAG